LVLRSGQGKDSNDANALHSTSPSALQFSNENGWVAWRDVGIGYNVRWRPDGDGHSSRHCPVQWGHTHSPAVDLSKCAADLKSQIYEGPEWLANITDRVRLLCLQENGYFKAAVKPSTEQLPDKHGTHQFVVIFTIDSGPQYRTGQISFRNNRVFSEEELRSMFKMGSGDIFRITKIRKGLDVSEHPVILAKRVESPPIVRAAKTIEDAEKGDFEYDPNVDYFPTELPPSPRFGEKPDEEHFITLAPEQSYEARVISGVFGATVAAKARKGSGLLAKGSHVLQLGVGAWPYQWPYFASSTDVKELSERWIKYGHLASGFVYSDFVPFAIPDTFDNPPCKDISTALAR